MCADCKRVVHAVWQERHRGVCTRVEDGRQLEGGSIRLRDRPRATVEPEENDVRPGGPLPHPERAKKCPLCAKIVAAEHECVIMDCALCGTRVNRTHYALHLGTTRHREAEEARWAQEQKACLACQGLEQEGHTCGFAPCGVCGVWVDSRFQAVHEATRGHRAAVVAAGQKEERKTAGNETPVNRCPSCKALIEEGHRCGVVQCDVYGGRLEAPHTATKKHRKAAEKTREEERARKAQEGGTSEGAAADITDGQRNWCLSRGEIATDAHRWGVVMLTTDVDGNEAGVEYRVGAERRAKERQQAREEELEREEKRREKGEKEKKKRVEIEKIEKERKKREEDERREREKVEKMEKERKERVEEEERKKMERMEMERKEREENEKKQREKMEKERKKREDDEKKERKKMEKMEKERKGREEKEKKKREEIEKERKERVKMEGEGREKEEMEQKEQKRKEKQEIEKQEQDRKEREKIEQRQFNAKKEEQRKETAKIKKRNEEQKQKLEKKKQEDQRQAVKQEHTARENTEEVHTQPAQGTGRRRKKKPTLDTPLNDAATPSLVVPKLKPSRSRTAGKGEARERRILEESRGVQEPMQTGPAEVQRLRETEKAVGDMEKHEEAEKRMQQVRQASASTETRLPEELQTAEKAKRKRGRSQKEANSIASQVQESTGASGQGGGSTPQTVKPRWTKETKAQRNQAQTQKLEEDEHLELEKTRLLELEEKQKQVRIMTVFSVHRADGHRRQCRMSGSWSWKR